MATRRIPNGPAEKLLRHCCAKLLNPPVLVALHTRYSDSGRQHLLCRISSQTRACCLRVSSLSECFTRCHARLRHTVPSACAAAAPAGVSSPDTTPEVSARHAARNMQSSYAQLGSMYSLAALSPEFALLTQPAAASPHAAAAASSPAVSA